VPEKAALDLGKKYEYRAGFVVEELEKLVAVERLDNLITAYKKGETKSFGAQYMAQMFRDPENRDRAMGDIYFCIRGLKNSPEIQGSFIKDLVENLGEEKDLFVKLLIEKERGVRESFIVAGDYFANLSGSLR
jgi:hypothetical protein